MYDLLLRNGTIVDGTGDAPYVGTVAISGGRIVAVGPDVDGAAETVIDASGKLVTPGFIDVHTHYDGQVTWDDEILPSAAHGVTTIVIGCCGIGFAPVRKGSEDWLIALMEGVEDIPGTALHVGIPWGWETYPQYLDALAKRTYAVDIVSQIPHSAVRAYVLGKRAELDEPATPEDLARMAEIVREGMRAGAVGFATSRVSMHRGSDGTILPGTSAPEDELIALGNAMRDGGGGVFQIIPSGVVGGVEGQEGEQVMAGLAHRRDPYLFTDEIERMRRVFRETGQPITFTFSENRGIGREEYEKAKRLVRQAIASGDELYPQYSPKQVNSLMTLGTYHPFLARPGYRAIAHLPVAERAREMARPEVKAAILSERDIEPGSDNPMEHMHITMARNLPDTYELDERMDMEPETSLSIAARAEAEGRDPLDLAYDLLISDEGRKVLIFFATNYLDGNLSKLTDLIRDPHFLIGLGDAGAHVSFICGGDQTTFTLQHWGRTRTRGETLPIELLVRRLTKDCADLYGLADRGVIAVGRKADLNVIDFERLRAMPYRLVNDLPTGAQRFLQDATGYAYTILSGEIVRRDDEDTRARPGRLVRKQAAAGQAGERELADA